MALNNFTSYEGHGFDRKKESGAKVPAPSIIVSVDTDARGNKSVIPTKESIKAYAKYIAKYGSADRIKVSGSGIGEMNLPPLWTERDNSNMMGDPDFGAWLIKVMGHGAISEIPAPELSLLMKVYFRRENIISEAEVERKKGIESGKIKNLKREELDSYADEIMSGKIGNPVACAASIAEVERVMYGSDNPDKEKKMPEFTDEGVQYIIGKILYKHIYERGRRIEVTGNKVKIVTDDPTKIPDEDKKFTDEQWTTYLASNMEFGTEGVAGFTPSKVGEYTAAYMYHANSPDLHSEDGLVKKKHELIGQVLGDRVKNVTHDDIKNSDLSPAEKSFLMLWTQDNESTIDRPTDARLREISENQTKYVKMAEKNTKGKSWEQLKRDLGNNTTQTILSVLPLVAAPAILFYLSTKIKNGFFSGAFKILAGVFTVGTIAAKSGAIDEFIRNSSRVGQSGQSYVDNLLETAPQAPGMSLNERTIGQWNMNKGPMLTSINRFWDKHRLWGQNSELEKIIGTDPKLGAMIATYPVGAMLAALNPALTGTPSDPYRAFRDIKNDKGALLIPEIQANLVTPLQKHSNGDQRALLNTVLEEGWDKSVKLRESISADEVKKLNLKDITEDREKTEWTNMKRKLIRDVGGEAKMLELLELRSRISSWNNPLKPDPLFNALKSRSGGESIDMNAYLDKYKENSFGFDAKEIFFKIFDDDFRDGKLPDYLTS